MKELAKWDEEHRKLLDEIAPERFDVLHYAALAVLRKKDETINHPEEYCGELRDMLREQ